MSIEKKRFILFGEAGAGKSTLINVLYNYFHGATNPDEVFCENTRIKLAIPCKYWVDRVEKSFAERKSNERDINNITISQTMKCLSYSFEKANICYEIIDTPGFNDTSGIGFDANNLNLIEEELRTVQYLNGIIVVINGSIDRVSVAFKNFLHLLHQVWGKGLFDACIGVLTNCDSSTVNLNPQLLYTELRINSDKTLYFQNNVFRWNRQKKPTKQLHEDFKEAVESVKMLLSLMQKSPHVPTESFLVSPIKLALIQNCIEASIQDLLNLVTAKANMEFVDDGITGSKLEMSRNTNRDFYHHIHAVAWEAVFMMPKKKSKDKTEPKAHHMKFVEDGHQTVSRGRNMQGRPSSIEYSSRSSSANASSTEKSNEPGNRRPDEYESKIMYRPKNVTVELVVPDGESIARYSNAQQEHINLMADKSRLHDERQQLEVSIASAYETLRQQVDEVHKINEDYDLLEKNSELLREFRSKAAAFPKYYDSLHKYYLATIEILSVK